MKASYPQSRLEKETWLDKALDRPVMLIAFLLIHALAAAALRFSPMLSQAFGLLTVGAGLIYCFRHKRPEYWLYLAGYIMASEVLIKMTRGSILWEQSKYLVIVVLISGMVMTRRARNAVAGIQFLLLLPSAVLTFLVLPLSEVRGALSFNLSGPLSLCVATAFCSELRLSLRQVHKLLLLMLGPLFGIAVVIGMNVPAMAAQIQFQNRSNFAVTGGFGPNQVSAALGLGILLCFFLIVTAPWPIISRSVLVLVVVGMAAQSAITFSRNGLYCGVGASLVATPFLMTNPRIRARFLIAAPLVLLAFGFVIIPKLDEFTGGQFSNRFAQTSSTGRDEIAGMELDAWKQSPILGVGPGIGIYVRADVWENAAHTEFTRLLAEHGTLGLMALLLYPVMMLRSFHAAGGALQKALVSGCFAWSISFMLVNAMRTAAPGFMFGLACAQIVLTAKRDKAQAGLSRSQPWALAPQGVYFRSSLI